MEITIYFLAPFFVGSCGRRHPRIQYQLARVQTREGHRQQKAARLTFLFGCQFAGHNIQVSLIVVYE